ncbi:hypothetical protein COCNU_04G011340 [Cocos nucifera]|uniref:Uncharacterized protein n=1 Tax=Cocos nucifera TaxID=13894 RepID=A0A8K0I6D5_COCNU|nr:hypothetical protein COCNU_04G011340 [Cocos nucifera]
MVAHGEFSTTPLPRAQINRRRKKMKRNLVGGTLFSKYYKDINREALRPFPYKISINNQQSFSLPQISREMGRTLLSSPVSMFRWPEFHLSNFTRSMSWSIFHRREFDFSFLTPSWPDINFSPISVVDSILWAFVTAFESVALLAMLCFFFVFCGCTL